MKERRGAYEKDDYWLCLFTVFTVMLHEYGREREREREPDFSINQSVVPTDAYLHRLGT